MIKKTLLLSILFLFVSTFTLLAQKHRISGTIYDEYKNPLERVSIKTYKGNGTLTNKKGKYVLELNEQDSIQIQFSSVGFKTYDILIPKLDKDITLDLALKDDALSLNETVITGKKGKPDPSMVIDIFNSDSRAFFLDCGIEKLVTMMPGVSSTDELSSQYQVRGGNFDENLVYINGIEVYRPLLIRSARQEGLSIINSSMVEQVAFSTGGYGAEYGDKTSSVLDITYKKPEQFEGRVSTSMMDQNAYLGSVHGKFHQMTSVRYKTTRSMLKSTDTKAEYDPSFLDFQTLMGFDFNPKWKLTFWGNYSGNSYKFTPRTRTTNFGTLGNIKSLKIHFNGGERDKFQTGQVALNLSGQVTDRLNLNLSTSYITSREQERYDITGSYRLTDYGENEQVSNEELLGVGTYHEHARNKLNVDIFRAEHIGELNLDKNKIKWGISVSAERFKDRMREWELRDSTGYLLPNAEGEIEMYSSLRSKNKLNSVRIGGFIQDRYNLNTDAGLFSFNAGLRFNYWDFNEKFFVSPRAHIRFIPSRNKNLSFTLAGGLYYQAPFYREFRGETKDANGNNTVFLNKDIKPQKSLHIILGNEFNFGQTNTGRKRFKLTNEIYYKKLDNLIPYTVDNLKIRYSGKNEGTGYIAGWDVRLYGELIPKTSSWIGFSLMKTQQKVGGKKAPLPTDQRFMVSAYLEDYMPGYDRLKLGITGVFAGGLPFSAPKVPLTDQHFRTPTYKRVDMSLSWEVLGEKYAIRDKNAFCGFFKNVWLGVEVLNLFDMKNLNTHYWVTDVYNNQFAVPNYLTGRKLNVRLVCEF